MRRARNVSRVGAQGNSGATGATGPAGSTGPTGSTSFNFDNATADADPGSGDLRLNNADPTLATTAYIDNNNRGGSDVSAWLDTFDDAGVSAGRGQLCIFDAAAPTTIFRIYNITGSVVDGTGYRKVTIAHVTGNGAFTNGNELLVAFFARGVTGSGDLSSANNLSDVASAATSRTNLGLGTGNSPEFAGVNLGHASDTTLARSAAGIVAVEGNPLIMAGKHTIWIPAAAMMPRTTNGAAPGTAEMATNKNMFKTLDFDTTTQEFAQFEVFFPKSWNLGTVTFQPVLSHASGSGNVVFGLAGVARSDDDAGDVAFGTAQTSDKTVGTANDIYIGPESSFAYTKTASSWKATSRPGRRQMTAGRVDAPRRRVRPALGDSGWSPRWASPSVTSRRRCSSQGCACSWIASRDPIPHCLSVGFRDT